MSRRPLRAAPFAVSATCSSSLTAALLLERGQPTAPRSTSARRARTTASMPTIAQILLDPSRARVHRDTQATVSPAAILTSVQQVHISVASTPTAQTYWAHSMALATIARARRLATGAMAFTAVTWMSAHSQKPSRQHHLMTATTTRNASTPTARSIASATMVSASHPTIASDVMEA